MVRRDVCRSVLILHRGCECSPDVVSGGRGFHDPGMGPDRGWSCSAAVVTSLIVGISRPVTSANSCAFGFPACGVAMSTARSVEPDVFTATREPAVRCAANRFD
jgi:hypothetical protein